MPEESAVPPPEDNYDAYQQLPALKDVGMLCPSSSIHLFACIATDELTWSAAYTGQMLYLPAGWFHEVTSFSEGPLHSTHLALNYWLHPPDNLDPGPAGFARPYSSSFWPRRWATTLEQIGGQAN